MDMSDMGTDTTRDAIKKDMDSLNDIVDFVSANRRKVAKGAGVGLVVGTILLGKCSYNAGEDHRFEEIYGLQNATEIENPYKAFGPNSMVSSQPAEKHLNKMKEGQQFWYRGKIVTLMEKKEDDMLGTLGYFAVGKDLMIVPIGSLPDDMTIHETFTKYSGRDQK